MLGVRKERTAVNHLHAFFTHAPPSPPGRIPVPSWTPKQRHRRCRAPLARPRNHQRRSTLAVTLDRQMAHSCLRNHDP